MGRLRRSFRARRRTPKPPSRRSAPPERIRSASSSSIPSRLHRRRQPASRSAGDLAMSDEVGASSRPDPPSMTSDIATPLLIALRSRLRQTVIWSSSVALMVVYFIASRLGARDGGGLTTAPLELLDLALILGWSTASLGDRPALPGQPRANLFGSARPVLHSSRFFTLLRVGVGLADALVVLVGMLVIAVACGFPPRTPREWAYVAGTSALIGVATSLQVEIIWMFSNRAIALLAAALLTATALHVAHASPSAPIALLGRLGFPVSALVSATEEPFRLDLAARALAAGVTYDLALVATLLALSGNRARG